MLTKLTLALALMIAALATMAPAGPGEIAVDLQADADFNEAYAIQPKKEVAVGGERRAVGLKPRRSSPGRAGVLAIHRQFGSEGGRVATRYSTHPAPIEWYRLWVTAPS